MDIQCYHVIGEIAKPCKREELDPILRRARETGGTCPGDVAEHLLFERSRYLVAQRLLNIGKLFGLLTEISENKFVLTDQGEKAIETGEIFVPERGTWTLWTSRDPLLMSPILCVASFKEEEAAHKEIYKDPSDYPSFDETPEFLKDTTDREITPPASCDRTAIRIDQLEGKVQKVSDTNAELSLLWNIGERNLRLEGTCNKKKVHADLPPPEVSFDDIWDELLANEGLSNQWTRQPDALKMSFNEIGDIERETMACDIEFSNPSLPDYGQFETSKAEQVPITARFQTHAQEWSNWRLKSRIRDFATSALYSKWWKEASRPFNGFHLRRPTRSRLALEAWNESNERADTRTWYLIAVEDWDLK